MFHVCYLYLHTFLFLHRWRKMRRASYESLNNRFVVNFYPTHEKEAALLVQNTLNDCRHWEEEIQRYLQYFVIYSTHQLRTGRTTASMNLGVVYGTPVIDSHNDPRVAYISNFVARLVRAAFPGAHYVEYFTLMKVIITPFAAG